LVPPRPPPLAFGPETRGHRNICDKIGKNSQVQSKCSLLQLPHINTQVNAANKTVIISLRIYFKME